MTTYFDSTILFNCDLTTAVRKENEKGIPHFHNRFEIVIIEKGFCRLTIDNTEYCAHEGQVVFICPFQIHSFSVDKNSSIRQIIIDDALILTTINILQGRIPLDPVFNADPSIFNLALQMLNEFFGERPTRIQRISPLSTRMSIKGILYMLCGELLAQSVLVESKKANGIVIEIIEYISKNFQSDISLCDIAKQNGYNYQYLSRLFNSHMNISFKKVLNQYRMTYAYCMLQDTDLPISTVCFEAGFQSIRAFNEVSVEIFGMTPKELRQSRIRY